MKRLNIKNYEPYMRCSSTEIDSQTYTTIANARDLLRVVASILQRIPEIDEITIKDIENAAKKIAWAEDQILERLIKAAEKRRSQWLHDAMHEVEF